MSINGYNTTCEDMSRARALPACAVPKCCTTSHPGLVDACTPHSHPWAGIVRVQ
jgi:hypothetical protein